jgi:uncharacterized protein (TIGR02001 family)
MRNSKILATLAVLSACAAANADVSSTWTLASDYDYRGITQTAHDFAAQGSIDFSTSSGWYIGAWGSNLDWGETDVDVEIDVYTGFSGTTKSGIGWDAGLLHYTYPDDSDFNFLEVYGSVSYEWFKAKLSYSTDFGGDSTPGDTPAYYLEGFGTFPLPASFSILTHVGYSGGDYWDDADSEYFDYSIGVGYSRGPFSFALKWIDGSDLEVFDGTPGNVLSSEARLVFTMATTFPWRNE